MSDIQNTNEFNFDELDDFDFGEQEPLSPKNMKELADREVARFKEEQKHKRTVDDAYDKILGRFKAAPRNDQAHYQAFKTERLERFKNLLIVAKDIARNVQQRDYYFDRLEDNILLSDERGNPINDVIINTVSDLIQCIVGENDYTDYEDRNRAIKALSIAIIDLAEGNI